MDRSRHLLPSQQIQILRSPAAHLNYDMFHLQGSGLTYVTLQSKVWELVSENVRVDLVIVQEKTSPLLSSEANTGVGVHIGEPRQHHTHFNGCARLHHS